MEKRPSGCQGPEQVRASSPGLNSAPDSESFVPLAVPRVPVGPVVVSTCTATGHAQVCCGLGPSASATLSEQLVVSVVPFLSSQGTDPEGLSAQRLLVLFHVAVANCGTCCLRTVSGFLRLGGKNPHVRSCFAFPPDSPSPDTPTSHPPSPSLFDYYLFDLGKRKCVLFFLSSPNSS